MKIFRMGVNPETGECVAFSSEDPASIVRAYNPDEATVSLLKFILEQRKNQNPDRPQSLYVEDIVDIK